jgi:phage gp16-like protein
MPFSRTDLSKYLAKLGRKGGKARLQTMTAEERREVASRAGKASGIARRAKVKKH